MTYLEKQNAEIETIKPRAFFIDLSDADVVRIYKKELRAAALHRIFLKTLSVALYSERVQTDLTRECM